MGQSVMQTEYPLGRGLHSRFLESLDASTRDRVFGLASSAAQALQSWAERYPVIRQIRILPLCMSVSAAAPFSSVEDIISTARVSLWVFTLDDLFDEGGLPEADLLCRADSYREVAFGRARGPFEDDLAEALCEVREDLGRYPLFGSLGDAWAWALCGTIEGMIRELDWRLYYGVHGADALPSYDEYIANGLYSIGGPPHIWAALIAADDLSTPDHLEHLRPMERIASTCVRLANDLQSHSKELAEGNVNSLVLLSRVFRQKGLSEEEAHSRAISRVRADISQGLSALGELRTGARTRTGRPEAVIADIARFVCEFYAKHDYHTYLLERN